MSDTICTLPDAFGMKDAEDIGIHFYHTDQSSRNNKVRFRQHMLCLLLEGNKHVASGSGHLAADHNRLLLVRAGNVLMTERTTVHNSYRAILFFFPTAFLLQLLERHQLMPSAAADRPGVLVLDKDDYIRQFETSLQTLHQQRFPTDALLKTKLQELLLYLVARRPDDLNSFLHHAVHAHASTPMIDVVCNPDNQLLTIDELAFLCNMSASTFKRKFAAVFGTSPRKYFISRRMHQAALLLHQQKRPSEIYDDLGYENLSAFSNEFKKHFGVSPGAYVAQV